MSLIVTSSSQAEYDTTTKNLGGIENPASYQNFLSSPLIIDPNSEIAVVSIKVNRDLDIIIVGENEGFFVYWGKEKPENFQEGGIIPFEITDIHTPLRIMLTPGEYSTSGFLNMVKVRLDAIVLKAFPEVKEIIIDFIETDDKLTIQFKQHGTGASMTDHPVASEYVPYIDAGTKRSYYDPSTHVVTQQTGNVTITDPTAGEVLISGYKASESTRACDVIGAAHPVSRVTSKVTMKFNGSQSATTNDGYTLGFVRSQGGTVGSTKTNFSAVGAMIHPVSETSLRRPGVEVKIPPKYGLGDGVDIAYPPFMFDIAFNWVNGQNAQVIHLVNSNDEDHEGEYKLEAITAAIAPTNASMEDNYWDRIEWEFTGEIIKLYLGRTASGTRDMMLDGSVKYFDQRFKPVGQTFNQLYPKIAIQNNDATTPGLVTVKDYTGHSNLQYYENNFWGYQSLEEEKDFLPPDSTLFKMLYWGIDFSSIYGDGTIRDGTLYNYVDQLAGSAGVGNLWSLIWPENPARGDYDSDAEGYFLNQDQIDSLINNDSIKRSMGMRTLLIQSEDAVVSAGGADVLFKSIEALENVALATNSMFIRMKNQALNTYNTNKRSISNIVYSCPRFDAQGNSGGKLFFEPHERVYVKFNNISQFVMNSFDIDIVDVNEKVIKNLLGNTIIVFHVRERK
tara:strand:+ start:3811 stop:5835 length:2025 start_codon:yes stop_codon:yes gene_type:complete